MTTFSELELSPYSGVPVELFLFSNGDKFWAVTSADEDIILNLTALGITASTLFSNATITGNITFSSIPIERTSVVNSAELNKAYINLVVPSTFVVANLLMFYPTSDIIAVTVLRYQRGTTATAQNILVEFLGRVVSSIGAGITVELRCEPITTSIKRIGLTQMYQRQCPHTLYSNSEGNCRAGIGVGGREFFKVTKALAGVEGVVGLTLTFTTSLVDADKPVGFYNGGMIYWKRGNYTYWRLIINQINATSIQINFPIPTLDADNVNPLNWSQGGITVDIYPGCAHTLSDCRDKFNNLDNYGGFPYIPLLNPFNGSTLF